MNGDSVLYLRPMNTRTPPPISMIAQQQFVELLSFLWKSVEPLIDGLVTDGNHAREGSCIFEAYRDDFRSETLIKPVQDIGFDGWIFVDFGGVMVSG